MDASQKGQRLGKRKHHADEHEDDGSQSLAMDSNIEQTTDSAADGDESALVAGAHFLLAQKLAHNKLRIRGRALRMVARWLGREEDIAPVDMMKLWKGIFYCFWMSDKVPVQQQLAQDLSALLLPLPKARGVLFFQAFCATMTREWRGIDRLRMDKFLSWVRIMMNHLFQYLHKHNWSTELARQLVNVLVHGDPAGPVTLAPAESKRALKRRKKKEREMQKQQRAQNGDVSAAPAVMVPPTLESALQMQQAATLARAPTPKSISEMDKRGGILLVGNDQTRGLALHMCDVFVTELNLVIAASDTQHVDWDVLHLMLEPFVRQVASSHDSSMSKRSLKEVLIPVVAALEAFSTVDQEDEEMKADESLSNLLALAAVLWDHLGALKDMFFSVAAEPSTIDRHRKSLYGLRLRIAELEITAKESTQREAESGKSQKQQQRRPQKQDQTKQAQQGGKRKESEVATQEPEQESKGIRKQKESKLQKEPKQNQGKPQEQQQPTVENQAEDGASPPKRRKRKSTAPSRDAAAAAHPASKPPTTPEQKSTTQAPEPAARAAEDQPETPPIARRALRSTPKRPKAKATVEEVTEVAEVNVRSEEKAVTWSATKNIRRFNKEKVIAPKSEKAKREESLKQLLQKTPVKGLLKTTPRRSTRAATAKDSTDSSPAPARAARSPASRVTRSRAKR